MSNTHGRKNFEIKAGGSVSLPNLRPSFRKMSAPATANENVLVQAEANLGSRFRSNSTPVSVMKRSSFFEHFPRPNPVPLPRFSTKDGYKNGSNVTTSTELIVGALKAGNVHFQRGMHYADVLALVRSASPLHSSPAATIMLNRALEKLVASGIVSKSYGGKAKDATYRLVMDNPRLTNQTPTLMISGTQIKSNANVRYKPGQCLPGGVSHLSRPAQQGAHFQQKALAMKNRQPGSLYPTGIPYNLDTGNISKVAPWNQVQSYRCDPVEYPAPPGTPCSADRVDVQNDLEGSLYSYEEFRSPMGDHDHCANFNNQVFGDANLFPYDSNGEGGHDQGVGDGVVDDTHSPSCDYESLLERLNRIRC